METAEKEILSIDITPVEDEQYIAPVQSANTLFHFFTEPDFLYSTLRGKALIPRFYAEYVDYLSIGLHQVAYPMVCFCDINIHRLEDHLSTYGNYGIAFSKKWGIHHGVQPIQYVNRSSILCNEFSKAFATATQVQEDIPVNDYLLAHMCYLKPISGPMLRNGVTIQKNFTDEREWRFVPNLHQIDLPQAVTDDYMSTIKVLNETISDNDCCWLKFSLSVIKYIILRNDADFEEICHIIEETTDDYTVQRRLFSKVLIWDNIKEDF